MKLIVLLAMFPVLLLGAELPEPVVPAGVGVNIHFTKGRERDLDLIAAAGFKFIRMDFSWSGTERKQGEYDWPAYDELTANLEKRGLRAIYIFDYSNALYEPPTEMLDRHSKKEHADSPSPQHPESVAAFARWSAAAATHFRGRHVIWEIWNEPNIGFWKPKPDVEQYTALALATAKAVREADPQATIVGPASSEFPWEFFEHMFASGVLKYLDAVSVHPYRQTPPETAAADFMKLRGLIAKHAPTGKKNLPIISGEWGYSTQSGGVPLETQAAYLARQQLSNLLNGVPLSIWYDWKNDGTDPNYNENNFGTVDHELKPKPSYLAAQTLTRELAGYRIARRLDVASEDDYVLLCVNAAGDQKLAVWTLGEAHAIALDAGSERLSLKLDAEPKYVALANASHSLAAAAAWHANVQPSVLVVAGRPGAARVAVTVANPFPQRVKVALSVDGLDAAAAKPRSLDVPSGKPAATELRGTLARRDKEIADVTVRAVFREQTDAGWTEIGTSTERLRFVVANPLLLSLAPVERGARLQIQNPAGVGFEGAVRAGENTQKVSFKNGQRSLSLDFAGSQAKPVQLLDQRGQIAGEIAAQTFQAVTLPGLRAALDGDKNVPAKANLELTDAPGASDAPFAKAFKLDYQFDVGWRFVRCAIDSKSQVPIEGRPAAVGLWIFGDNSGNALRLRVVDESWQTFQLGQTSIKWSGWRWVTFDCADLRHAGHWGGANDGVVHGALHWDSPLLLDGRREKTSGTIYFAGLTLLYP